MRALWIGAIVVAAIAMIVVIFGIICSQDGLSLSSSRRVSGYRPTTNYVADLTPGQKRVIENLVYKAAPLVSGKRFLLEDLQRIIGPDPALDQVMYFRFRQLLAEDRLSVRNMESAITTGS